jgi:hypothetical protein
MKRIRTKVVQTVKLKAGSDESILSAMETITDRLPDVEIYGRVYADAKLASLLADAYTGVICFAREAIVYFRGRGICEFAPDIRICTHKGH